MPGAHEGRAACGHGSGHSVCFGAGHVRPADEELCRVGEAVVSGRLGSRVEAIMEELIARSACRRPTASIRARYGELLHVLASAGLQPPSYTTFRRRCARFRQARLAAVANATPVLEANGSIARRLRIERHRHGAGAILSHGLPVPSPAVRGPVGADRSSIPPAPRTRAAVHQVPLDLFVTCPAGGRPGRPLLTITASIAADGTMPAVLRIAFELTLPGGV